jgi:major membrane immunogen (membrane-anchored lipoprotein)
MFMKKLLFLLLVALVAFAACNGDDAAEADDNGSEAATEAPTYEDGVYFAMEDDFAERSGWKYAVTMVVENGEITEVEWNGAHRTSGTDKVTRSESGEYGMVENGGAQWPWYEQAENAEAYLIDLQDPAAMELDGSGYTDAVSGVTIHINELQSLAQEALDQGPVGYGDYADGHFTAEAAEFSGNGWKDRVDVTVISGYIAAIYWNPVNEEGTNKYQASVDGEYGMVENSDAQAPWFEQADAAEAAIIEAQDPMAIELDDEGYPDAISGVSVHIDALVELTEEALEAR